MNSALENWHTVRALLEALQINGRPLATLIAVSKSQPLEAILPLLDAGHRDFGENKVQEAMEKWPALRERYPNIRLHLIGSLQSNKVKEALGFFDVLHTVDRESLVDALVKERAKLEHVRCNSFFLQVNTGEEPQKGGMKPGETAALYEYCHAQGLIISGLMCVPPAEDLPAPHFALMRTLADGLGLKELSMGMSGDYETALRLGATYVRIGTALFGERPHL